MATKEHMAALPQVESPKLRVRSLPSVREQRHLKQFITILHFSFVCFFSKKLELCKTKFRLDIFTMENKVIGAQEFFREREQLIPAVHSPIIIADGLQTPENMGLVLRVADNAGCQKVIFVGDENVVRLNKIKKTAQTSFKLLNWLICKAEELEQHIPPDYPWIGIETAEHSTSLYEFTFPKNGVFVLGNEAHGISPSLLQRCQHVVHIPMFGNTVSMNVSHALTAVLFVYRTTWK